MFHVCCCFMLYKLRNNSKLENKYFSFGNPIQINSVTNLVFFCCFFHWVTAVNHSCLITFKVNATTSLSQRYRKNLYTTKPSTPFYLFTHTRAATIRPAIIQILAIKVKCRVNGYNKSDCPSNQQRGQPGCRTHVTTHTRTLTPHKITTELKMSDYSNNPLKWV